MSRTPVLFAVVAMMSLPVNAEERDSAFKLGVGAGIANLDFDYGFAASDTALSVFAGYDFNRYLSIEAGYVDAGSPEENGVTVTSSYATVTAIASLPLWRHWSICARVGAAAGSWESSGIERTDTVVVVGAGTAVDFDRFQVRLVGDALTIDDARIVHFSVQGAWKF
jgi:hypothetical protein